MPKKQFAKILALVLAAVMLLPMFAACDVEDVIEDETTKSEQQTVKSEETTTEKEEATTEKEETTTKKEETTNRKEEITTKGKETTAEGEKITTEDEEITPDEDIADDNADIADGTVAEGTTAVDGEKFTAEEEEIMSDADIADSTTVESTTVTETTFKEEMTTIEKIEKDEYDFALENLLDNREVDMDGDEFYILTGVDIAERFNIDEPQDDILNQAVYERNLAFNETFNAEISVIERNRMCEEFKYTLSNDVRSSNEIHITFGRTDNTPPMITEGLLYNFLNLENVDLDAEWWDQGTKSFNIADSIWFMNGASNVDDDLTTFIMMFNTEMYDDLFPNEDRTLYEIVDDNDWTLAKFSEYIQSASADNGDNIWDENDTYGLVTADYFGISIFYGSGLKYITCEEGEEPYISFDDNDKQIAINILEDVIPFYTNRYAYMSSDVSKPMNIFTGGRSLFYCEIIDYIVRYCNPLMEEDYGVLPVPKYDANQDGYIGWTHAISSSMSIANNVTDPEEMGTLIEGYAILSQKYVTPALYDKVLDRQSAYYDENSEMLRMVLANRTYDLAAYYTDMGLTAVFSGCFAGLNTNFESLWKAQSKRAVVKLRQINKNFEKLSN